LTNYGIYDSTSHLKTDAVPLGGNIGFVDGHVAWRPFDDMGGRYGGDRLFWW
jgi:prepilin-type processing-associated H-X9-DG protein